MIFCNAVAILGFIRFLLPKLVQIFFTQGVTSPLQISFKSTRTPGNSDSISLSIPFTLTVELEQVDWLCIVLSDTALEMRSKTSSKNNFRILLEY
jgi:hypothetical protein